MIGAIIGDLAGSIYEYNQLSKIEPIKNISKIIPENSFFSDDTILTIAIADAILDKVNYETKLKEYGKYYIDKVPKDLNYFKKMFSPSFVKWLHGDYQGNSNGNGAMMRISPVGYLFNTKEEVIENARLATIPSHNSQEAINNSTLVALIIFYARQGLSKDKIIEKLDLNIAKPKLNKFNTTCNQTINLCLYSAFSATTFEDSIKTALSFGGDTDTNACITGSIAQALYGVSKELENQAYTKLPTKFINIIKKANIISNKINLTL